MADTQRHFPVKLTQAQRKVVAEIAPELSDRLKLDEKPQRTIPFTLAELKAINWLAKQEATHAKTGMKRNSLRHVTELAAQALERSQGIGAIPAAEDGAVKNSSSNLHQRRLGRPPHAPARLFVGQTLACTTNGSVAHLSAQTGPAGRDIIRKASQLSSRSQVFLTV